MKDNLLNEEEKAILNPMKENPELKECFLEMKGPDKILQTKSEDNLGEISQDLYQEYFGWLSDYSSPLLLWGRRLEW